MIMIKNAKYIDVLLFNVSQFLNHQMFDPNSNANTATGSPLRIPYFWNYKTVKHKEFYLLFAYLTHRKGKNNCWAAGDFLCKTVILIAGLLRGFLHYKSQKY